MSSPDSTILLPFSIFWRNTFPDLGCALCYQHPSIQEPWHYLLSNNCIQEQALQNNVVKGECKVVIGRGWYGWILYLVRNSPLFYHMLIISYLPLIHARVGNKCLDVCMDVSFPRHGIMLHDHIVIASVILIIHLDKYWPFITESTGRCIERVTESPPSAQCKLMSAFYMFL